MELVDGSVKKEERKREEIGWGAVKFHVPLVWINVTLYCLQVFTAANKK